MKKLMLAAAVLALSGTSAMADTFTPAGNSNIRFTGTLFMSQSIDVTCGVNFQVGINAAGTAAAVTGGNSFSPAPSLACLVLAPDYSGTWPIDAVSGSGSAVATDILNLKAASFAGQCGRTGFGDDVVSGVWNGSALDLDDTIDGFLSSAPTVNAPCYINGPLTPNTTVTIAP